MRSSTGIGRSAIPICSRSRPTTGDAQLEPGLLPVLAFPGGYGGIVVGDHGRTTLAITLPSSKGMKHQSRNSLSAWANSPGQHRQAKHIHSSA